MNLDFKVLRALSLLLCLNFGAMAQSPIPSDPKNPDEEPVPITPLPGDQIPGAPGTNNLCFPNCGGGGFSQPDIPVIEWDKREATGERLAAYGTDLLGDAIDQHTGGLSFQQTDISIPGNSALPVALARKLENGFFHYGAEEREFGDWTYDVPRIHVVTAQAKPWTGQRCNNPAASFDRVLRTIGQNSSYVHPVEYSNGLMMDVPGVGSQRLTQRPTSVPYGMPTAAKYVTADHWYVRCGSASDGGEGFIATAPNGDEYRFDEYIVADTKPLAFHQWTGAAVIPDPADTETWFRRERGMLMATQVTDIHGNWVKYDYDSSGRLTKIHANDGRQITLSYSGSSKIVSSATANGRTWNYAYKSVSLTDDTLVENFANKKLLSTVTLPNGKFWTFNLDDMFVTSKMGRTCGTFTETVSLTHPYGVTGTFDIKDYEHRRALSDWVLRPGHCTGGVAIPPPPNPSINDNDHNPQKAMSVVSKTLSGSNIPTSTWTFTYELDTEAPQGSNGPIATDAADPTNWTKVVAPDGSETTYYHFWNIPQHATYGDFGGKLHRVEVRSAPGGALLETQTMDYLITREGAGNYTPNNYPQAPVDSTFTPNSTNHQIVTKETVINRNGDTYTTLYDYTTSPSSSTYDYGSPYKTTLTSSTATGSRINETTYHHDTGDWILSQPQTIKRNSKEFVHFTYNGDGLITSARTFGATAATTNYTYHTDGNLRTLTDPLGRITELTSYKRGAAQSMVGAKGTSDQVSVSRVIDNNGWVTSTTNGRGHTTSYGHNNMGWLTSINRPGSFTSTSISYAINSSGVTQTSTRGNSRSIMNYDNYLRPTLTQGVDLTGHSAARYTKMTYDAMGREIFASWPSTSSNPTAGVDTTYDALGRVTQTQETVSPNATTATAYLTNNRIEVTDPVGAKTTTTYRAFGAPGTDEAIVVVDATSTTTTMTRDVYGNITNINQTSNLNGYSVNVDRKFWYDDRLRLCRHRAPEIGDELFAYDNANQLTMSSRGEAVGSTCGTPSAARRTAFSYDAMGRQTLINFPTGTADISKTYDANGNALTINRGGINWTYTYNELDLPTSETLVIDSRTYATSHFYDSSGFRTAIHPAKGKRVDYDSNGFGEPRAFRTGSWYFANNIAYHPNGIESAATYKNTRQLTQTINARQQVTRKTVSGSISDLGYGYDARGKITAITDYVNSSENRSFLYDDRGRLVTANGPWGNGSFQYDGLDNTRERVLGSRTTDMEYDSATNRILRYKDSGEGNVWQSFAYDSLGNVRDNGLMAHGGVDLTYDWASQPIAMVGAGFANTYTYDGNLKRVKSIENGKVTYWIYSSVTGGLLAKETPADSVGWWYVSGASTRVRHRMENGFYEMSYLDHQGSAVAATHWFHSNVEWRESYTPFGEKRIDPTDNRNHDGYTGHIQDDASGLTYMQARYYDPVIGRFLSTDPIGYQDQMNLYAYVANDPVNMVDPDGEHALAIGRIALKHAVRQQVRSAGASHAAKSGSGGFLRTVATALPGVGEGIDLALDVAAAVEASTAQSDAGTVDKNGNFTTPEGKIVRNHGKKGDGEAYLKGKGHTGESVDQIFDDTADSFPSGHDNASGTDKTPTTVTVGNNGDWARTNDETGEVIQVNDKNNPKEKPPKKSEEN